MENQQYFDSEKHQSQQQSPYMPDCDPEKAVLVHVRLTTKVIKRIEFLVVSIETEQRKILES